MPAPSSSAAGKRLTLNGDAADDGTSIPATPPADHSTAGGCFECGRFIDLSGADVPHAVAKPAMRGIREVQADESRRCLPIGRGTAIRQPVKASRRSLR